MFSHSNWLELESEPRSPIQNTQILNLDRLHIIPDDTGVQSIIVAPTGDRITHTLYRVITQHSTDSSFLSP